MTEREAYREPEAAAAEHQHSGDEHAAPSLTARPLATAGVWLGLGLGGFFDGIVFHQILQWHHMLTSAGYPPSSVANLEMNTLRIVMCIRSRAAPAAGAQSADGAGWLGGRQATPRHPCCRR